MGKDDKKRKDQKTKASATGFRNLVFAAPESTVDINAVYQDSIARLHAIERATLEGLISTRVCDSVVRASLLKLQFCVEFERKQGVYLGDQTLELM